MTSVAPPTFNLFPAHAAGVPDLSLCSPSSDRPRDRPPALRPSARRAAVATDPTEYQLILYTAHDISWSPSPADAGPSSRSDPGRVRPVPDANRRTEAARRIEE